MKKNEIQETEISEQDLVDNYQQYFDSNVAFRLLKKLRKATRDKPKIISGSTGAIVTTLGTLLSALDNPDMPAKYKAITIGAIGYIVLPTDLIADTIPVVGYADDFSIVASAVAAVAAYSNFSLELLDAEIDREMGKSNDPAIQSEVDETEEIEDDNDQNSDTSSVLAELEALIPVVQNYVAENGNIDFQYLQAIENLLDSLEDEKVNIPEDDKNNIDRCKKKTLATLNRCSNKDDIQVDIDIITESFDNILG